MDDTNKGVIPLIRDDKGNYLLITRTEHPEHKDEWGPISGHAKIGETMEDALIRETKEEVDLIIRPLKQIAVMDLDIPGHVGYWWTCEILSGQIHPNEEIDQYKYFSSDEIKNLKLWPATRKFFEKFIWKKI